jgi:hypothetical protein
MLGQKKRWPSEAVPSRAGAGRVRCAARTHSAALSHTPVGAHTAVPHTCLPHAGPHNQLTLRLLLPFSLAVFAPRGSVRSNLDSKEACHPDPRLLGEGPQQSRLASRSTISCGAACPPQAGFTPPSKALSPVRHSQSAASGRPSAVVISWYSNRWNRCSPASRRTESLPAMYAREARPRCTESQIAMSSS